MSRLFRGVKKAHFIGIGGIGISAIARLMLLEGIKVTGSDMSPSRVTEALKKAGAKIYIGHNKKNLEKGTDLVVYTHAIPGNNEEFTKARLLGIRMLSYPEALGEVSRGKYTIAVSGTHGKTTTTAMLAEILLKTGEDPTVIVGSFLSGKENLIVGESSLFVAEACEYKKSFLELSPNVLIITNIDNDHLDYYKTSRNIVKAFRELAQKVPKEGFIIANLKDKKIKQALRGVSATRIHWKDETPPPLISVIGKHNEDNARCALATTSLLGVNRKKAEKIISQFKGTWRRQEYKGKTKKGALVYDDYAHHPTEIKATLQGFKKAFPKERIIVIFQPHLYSRTKALLKDFGKSFKYAHEVFVLPIYAAREKDDGSISHDKVVREIKKQNKNTHSATDISTLPVILEKRTKKGDMVLTIGAGDVYIIGEELVK